MLNPCIRWVFFQIHTLLYIQDIFDFIKTNLSGRKCLKIFKNSKKSKEFNMPKNIIINTYSILEVKVHRELG